MSAANFGKIDIVRVLVLDIRVDIDLRDKGSSGWALWVCVCSECVYVWV